MFLIDLGTLDATTATNTKTLDDQQQQRYEGKTIVMSGTFAGSDVLEIVVNDGVNDRLLGHWSSPGKVTIQGRVESITATLRDLSNAAAGINALTTVTARMECMGSPYANSRHASVNRAIRDADAAGVVLLYCYPATPVYTNQLPDGADRHTSEHTVELDGAITGGVGLTVEMMDGAGVETELAIVTDAMLPWQSALITGDMARVSVTVPAGFTTAGLMLTTCHSIEEA